MNIRYLPNNPHFKGVEFDAFMNEAGANVFTLSPKRWVDTTGAIGIISRAGSGGGTFAHRDIAFKFAAWISAEFELYLIKDYQRLKNDEGHKQQLEWNAKREFAKLNYRIHTDAIKEHLLPVILSKQQISFTYATEADVLNVSLFGKTAKQWREQNPTESGNMRDYASIPELIVLVNIESMNAELIKQGMSQKERLLYLNKMAIEQMRSLIKGSQEDRIKQVLLPEQQDV